LSGPILSLLYQLIFVSLLFCSSCQSTSYTS
jgi:hypothetical protein